MTEWQFEPEKHQTTLTIPFFEDARADFAPYYDIRNKRITDAQNEVIVELAKLGGSIRSFVPGIFLSGESQRHGFEIYFSFHTAEGLIRVAGLPFKYDATPNKLLRAKLQALLNVRDWLKAALTAQVFSPGASILIPFMLVDGKHTIADYIHSTGKLPRLNPSVEQTNRQADYVLEE